MLNHGPAGLAIDAIPGLSASEAYFNLSSFLNDMKQKRTSNSNNGIQKDYIIKADIDRLITRIQTLFASMLSSEVHWMNKDILPLVLTDDTKHTMKIVEFHNTTMQQVPAGGTSRTFRKSVTEIISKSERYGMHFELDMDVLDVAEGQDEVFVNVRVVLSSMLDVLSSVAYRALVDDVTSEIFNRQAELLNDKAMLYHLIDDQIEMFAICNKRKIGIAHIIQKYRVEMERVDKRPKVCIIPPKKRPLLISGSSSLYSYDKAGQEGVDRLMHNGAFQKIGDIEIRVAPSYFNSSGTDENSFGRYCRLGEQVILDSFPGMAPEGRRTWMIFDVTVDDYVRLTEDSIRGAAAKQQGAENFDETYVALCVENKSYMVRYGMIDGFLEHELHFLLIRPFCTYRMQDLTIVAPGDDLGNTFTSKRSWCIANDSNTFMFQAGFRSWAGTFIKDRKRLKNARNAFYDGIVQGVNVKFLNYESIRGLSNDNFNTNDFPTGSIYVLPYVVPKGRASTVQFPVHIKDIMFTSGKNPCYNTDENEFEFPGAYPPPDIPDIEDLKSEIFDPNHGYTLETIFRGQRNLPGGAGGRDQDDPLNLTVAQQDQWKTAICGNDHLLPDITQRRGYCDMFGFVRIGTWDPEDNHVCAIAPYCTKGSSGHVLTSGEIHWSQGRTHHGVDGCGSKYVRQHGISVNPFAKE